MNITNQPEEEEYHSNRLPSLREGAVGKVQVADEPAGDCTITGVPNKVALLTGVVFIDILAIDLQVRHF